MAKRRKPPKARKVSSKSARRKKKAPLKAHRKPKARPVKPKRKPAPARPKPKKMPAAAKGPSVAALQRRIVGLEEQLLAREHDRAEAARWRDSHSQLQEQVKAKDSALAFKEKEILDLRRQIEELKLEAKQKGASA